MEQYRGILDPFNGAIYVAMGFLKYIVFNKERALDKYSTLRFYGNDDVNNTVEIYDTAPIDASVIAARPAVVVLLGGSSYANVGIDQLTAEEFVPRPGMFPDVQMLRKEHLDLITGGLTFSCVAKTAFEARMLGYAVGSSFRAYMRTLRRFFFHDIGTNVQWSPESPPGAILSGDIKETAVMVQVSTPFAVPEHWFEQPVTEPHMVSAVLKEVNIHLDIDDGDITQDI